MRRVRVIPVLLVQDGKLVKTKRFKNPNYVGDPINAIRIFNEKGVDELVVCDISKSRAARGPDISLLRKMASEAFMPMAYAGGITSIDQGDALIQLGFEKVGLNTALGKSPDLVCQLASRLGSQSVAASVDYRKHMLFGLRQYTDSGRCGLKGSLIENTSRWVELGAGEIWLNAIDHEGSYAGYDCATVSAVSSAVTVPVVAIGGCGDVQHIRQVVDQGASAAAVGAMFVYQRPHEAVLISYLKEEIILD